MLLVTPLKAKFSNLKLCTKLYVDSRNNDEENFMPSLVRKNFKISLQLAMEKEQFN